MSSTLHLLRKDLRRMRVLLFAWAAVVLCIRVLAAFAVRPGAHQALAAASAAGTVASFVEQGLLGLVVAILFLEDSPASTTGFLLTRPVSNACVLRAKACLVVLLLAYVVAADLSVLVVAQAAPRDLALAVPHVLLRDLEVILPAALLASVASSLIRLLIWAAICGAGYFVVESLIQLAVQLNGSVSAGLEKSRTLVSLSLLAAGLSVALVQQFRRRRSGASAIGAAATIVLTLIVSCLWPTDFFAPPPAVFSTTPGRIQATLYESSLSDVIDQFRAGSPHKNFGSFVLLGGLPPDRTAIPKSATIRLTAANGVAVPLLPGSPFSQFAIPRRALNDAMSGDFIFGSNYFGDAVVPASLAGITASTLRTYEGQRLRLHGTMNFDLARYAPLYALSVSMGARADLGPESDTITEVLQQPDAVEILVQRRTVISLFAPPARPLLAPGYACYVPERQFYLVNPLRHEAIASSMSGAEGAEWVVFRSEENDGLITEETISVHFGSAVQRLTPDVSPEWLAGARLVEVAMQTEGPVEANLDRNSVTLTGNNYDEEATWPVTPIESKWFSQVPLSAHPSKEEARQYVDDISAIVENLISSEVQHSDLPGEAYARVGTDNLDVLIAAADGQSSFFIIPVVLRIAIPDNKAVILRGLRRHVELVDLVTKFHWEQEARPALLAVLSDPKYKDLPKNWAVAAAALNDPSTYPLLLNYLIHGHGRWATYNAIRKLPGIAIKPAIRQAWAVAQGEGWMNKVDAAEVAARIGIPDALDTLIQVLRINDVGHPQQFDHALATLLRLTPATGDAGSIVAWYDVHHGHLMFDGHLHKFVPGT